MFEDDDDDLERSEFEIWYDDNRNYFLRGATGIVEPSVEIEAFYIGVYCPAMHDLMSAIRQLLVKQYPIIATESRPAVLQAIERRIEITGHTFLLYLFDLVQDQKEGINLPEKYPDFEKWRVAYRTLHKPYKFDESFFDQFPWLTDEQKNEFMEESRKEEEERFNWKDKRKYDFINMLQRIVLKYYKEIMDFEADQWIVYSSLITNEYAEYRIRFEHYVTFIEYEFPEEDLYISYSEFSKKFHQRFNERWEKEQQLRKNNAEGLKD